MDLVRFKDLLGIHRYHKRSRSWWPNSLFRLHCMRRSRVKGDKFEKQTFLNWLRSRTDAASREISVVLVLIAVGIPDMR